MTTSETRLVKKGFSQISGVNFDETFVRTPATSSTRRNVATALEKKLTFFHLDAGQAFMESELNTEVYMLLLPGRGGLSENFVRLSRSLHGLKQASRR